MKEEQLVVRKIKRKKYNSYKGEIGSEVENVIKRDFHADKPNVKWLTDITEFHIPAGKIYLSPIIRIILRVKASLAGLRMRCFTVYLGLVFQ